MVLALPSANTGVSPLRRQRAPPSVEMTEYGWLVEMTEYGSGCGQFPKWELDEECFAFGQYFLTMFGWYGRGPP